MKPSVVIQLKEILRKFCLLPVPLLIVVKRATAVCYLKPECSVSGLVSNLSMPMGLLLV
jgi:hypothetical protein